MSDENFTLFTNKMETIMGSVSPLKTIRIAAKRQYVEP